MANYIHQLQEQVIETNERIVGLLDRIKDFEAHLQTSKFAGPGNDYIQTADVNRWLRYIESGGH